MAVLIIVLLIPTTCVHAIGFDAEDIYESVVVVHAGDSLGSGFAIRENWIITNAHVIGDANRVFVSTYGGDRYKATVLFCEEELDLAVLVTPDATFTPLSIASIDASKIGDDVYTVGAPKSMTYTLTKGVISAKQRILGSHEYIQIDAAINSGNSGGPLLNDAGEVLGVNTLKMSDSEGIGLAIPMEVVSDFLDNNENNVDHSDDTDDEEDTLPLPDDTEDRTDTKTRNKNSVLILLLSISVSLNILFFILLLMKRNRKTIQTIDPSERTDFEIEIEE